MKVRYIGENYGICLTHGKIYEALGYEHCFIRVIDDTEEDYLYHRDNFEVIEDDEN